MACFSKLPAEMALEIAMFMPTNDCLALSRTCSTLHRTLTPHLYANVQLILNPSELVAAANPLETFYANLVAKEERQSWVTALVVCYTYSHCLGKRDRKIISALIDMLPHLCTFNLYFSDVDLSKEPSVDSPHGIQRTTSFSQASDVISDYGRQVQLLRSTTNVHPLPSTAASLVSLVWYDSSISLWAEERVRFFVDFVRPLKNIRFINLGHAVETLPYLDPNVLPNLESVAGSVGAALALLPGRRVQRLNIPIYAATPDPNTWTQSSTDDFETVKVLTLWGDCRSDAVDPALIKSLVKKMTNLEVLDLSLTNLFQSWVLGCTKLQFLRLGRWLLPGDIQLLFRKIKTLECIEWVMKAEVDTTYNGELVKRQDIWGRRLYRNAENWRDIEWTCEFEKEWLGDWRKDIRDYKLTGLPMLHQFLDT